MRDRESFLRQLDASLPFDDAERAEIVDEIAAHLDDSAGALRGGGLAPDVAERAAIDRLGPPEALATELTHARRSPRRMLVAAGAGSWALVSGAGYGWLVGAGLGLMVGIALSLALPAISAIAGRELSFGTGQESNAALTIATFLVMAYVAGRRLPATVASRAGYRRARVQPVAAAIGGVLLLGYAVLGWAGPLSWPTVAMLLSLPSWWVLGTTRPGTLRLKRRWPLLGAAAAFVFLSLYLLAALGPVSTRVTSGGGPVTGITNEYQTGVLDRIGLPAPELQSVSGASGSGSPVGDFRTWSAVIFRDPAALGRWRDLRIEAWRGVDHPGFEPPVGLDPNETSPIAIAAVDLSAAPTSSDGRFTFPPPDPRKPSEIWWPNPNVMVSGAVATDRVPGLNWAWVAITGLAPDGRRHVIEGPQLVQTSFHGTVLDWLVLSVRGR